jgi:hypothetical protein
MCHCVQTVHTGGKTMSLGKNNKHLSLFRWNFNQSMYTYQKHRWVATSFEKRSAFKHPGSAGET